MNNRCIRPGSYSSYRFSGRSERLRGMQSKISIRDGGVRSACELCSIVTAVQGAVLVVSHASRGIGGFGNKGNGYRR